MFPSLPGWATARPNSKQMALIRQTFPAGNKSSVSVDTVTAIVDDQRSKAFVPQLFNAMTTWFGSRRMAHGQKNGEEFKSYALVRLSSLKERNAQLSRAQQLCDTESGVNKFRIEREKDGYTEITEIRKVTDANIATVRGGAEKTSSPAKKTFASNADLVVRHVRRKKTEVPTPIGDTGQAVETSS